MSTLIIAENWVEFPLSPNVPSRTALGQETALQQASANRSRSIAQLTDAVTSQDIKIASLNQSVERTTRDLAVQMSRLSSQLRDQDKELVAIQSRLSRIEIALNSRQQDPLGE